MNIEAETRGVVKGVAEGRANANAETILRVMKGQNISFKKAVDMLMFPAAEHQKLARLVAKLKAQKSKGLVLK